MTCAVSGASGKFGRLAAEELLTRVPASEVVLTTRSPDSLADLAERGADVRFADFDDPASLGPAFAGVERIFVVSATNATGQRDDQHGAAIDAIEAAGVERLVFPSMPKVDDPAHPVGLSAQEYNWVEQRLLSAELNWTVARYAPYTELHVVERLVEAGQWRQPLFAEGVIVTNAGEGKAPFISRRDCAATAIALLLSDDHHEAVYDLSGSRSWSWPEVAAVLTETLGREIRCELVDDDGMRAAAAERGASGLALNALVGMGKAVRTGYFDVCTDLVPRLTGREAISLPEVVAEHRQQYLAVPTA